MKLQIPDISVETRAEHSLCLDRVGMRKIECPIQMQVNGKLVTLPSSVDAFVSLDQPDAKGIHMSRLFLLVSEALERNELSFDLLEKLLKAILASHEEVSKSAEVKVSFLLPVKRKALKSDEAGWRQYPVSMMTRLDGGRFTHRYILEVMYSSTCPCSAALSRHLMQSAFHERFHGKTMTSEEVHTWLGEAESTKGVAHAQRSRAKVVMEFQKLEKPLLQVIDDLEAVLGTPVQAAVKRVDEQEFARLNAEHLMFCEDAGRKLKVYLDNEAQLSDYLAEVCHEESLHPHDAVSAIVKGVPNGLRLQNLN